MRTNVVLDAELLAAAMKKAGARTMRETIDIALREYVRAPDYAALLALGDSDVIAPGYDPKGSDPPRRVAERRAGYRARRPR